MKRRITLTALSLCLVIGLQQNVPATAIGEVQRGGTSQKLFKGKISYQLVKAEGLMSQRKYKDAAEIFKKTLKRKPNDVDALTGLGMSYAMEYKLGAAESLFDKVLEIDPPNALAHTGKAMTILYKLQSSNKAITDKKVELLKRAEGEAQQAILDDDNNPQAHYALGMIYKEQGRFAEAEREFQFAVDSDPEYSAGFAGLAMSQYKQNNIAAAQTNFLRAVNLYSGNSTAHYGLGEIYLKQGNYDAAIKELNTSLYQFRNSAPVHLALGKAYEGQGNNDAALKSYEKAVLIKPELKEAYKRMANLHVALGNKHVASNNVVGALKEFKQAILIDPYNSEPYLKMADMRESRGDLELAIADMRNGLELNPDQVQLRQRVAENLLKLEKLDDAIKEFQKALSQQPGNTRLVDGLTRALYLKAQKNSQGAFLVSNDYESAMGLLDKAQKMKPNDLQIKLAQAKLRALSGQPVDLKKVGSPTTNPERISYAEALLAQNKFKQSSNQMHAVIASTSQPQDVLAVADLALMIKDLKSAEMAYKKVETMGKQKRAKRGMEGVSRIRKKSLRQLTLAEDLRRRRMLPSAVDSYRQAIANNPQLADARIGLAEAERRLYKKSPNGLRDSAIQYKAYMDLSPNLPEKEVKKLNKRIEKLNKKAFKIEEKQKRK